MSLHYHIIPVTAFVQNSTVIWCDITQHAAVVDPGGDSPLVESFITEHRLVLQKVLLTHGHIDHAGSAQDLAKRYHIPIIGPHNADTFWLDRLSEQAALFDFPDPISPALILPIQWLNHGDSVDLGKEVLRVFHCPGHTPGHVVFYSAKAALILAGDVLFKNSVGRSDLPQSDGQMLLESIRNHLFVLPDNTAVIPGHGPMTTIGDEKRENPFFAHH